MSPATPGAKDAEPQRGGGGGWLADVEEEPRRGASWGHRGPWQGWVGVSRAGSPRQSLALQTDQQGWTGRGEGIIWPWSLGTPLQGVDAGSDKVGRLQGKPGCGPASCRGWGAQGKRQLIEVVRNKGSLSTAENRRENTPELINFLQHGWCRGSYSHLGSCSAFPEKEIAVGRSTRSGSQGSPPFTGRMLLHSFRRHRHPACVKFQAPC